jgi:hypothetical protein
MRLQPLKNNMEKPNKKFVITKKIAKHGNQSIIVIPRMLEQHLKPGTVVQLNIDVLQNFVEMEGK